ncbi:MAG: T9SS type A sorting domain-containing protein [Chitinophagaceae bacterium]
MVASPSNADLIFAATSGGLKITQNAGTTWAKPSTLTTSARINDLEISTDGSVVLATTSSAFYVSTDGGTTFSSNKMGANGLPSSASRVEVAIAPSNKDVWYLVTSSGSNGGGIYKTTDAGASWTTLGIFGLENFSPLGDQGTYDIALGVHPTIPDMVYLGGQLHLMRYIPSIGWHTIAYANANAFFGGYVHADMHGIVFNPNDPENMNVICDGGFFRTQNASATSPFFSEQNNSYNTIQCYGVAANRLGHIVYGAQDNGSGYIGNTPNSPLFSRKVVRGDGTRGALSDLQPNIVISSRINGALLRATDGGATTSSFNSFFDKNIDTDDPSDGLPNGHGLNQSNEALWVSPVDYIEKKINDSTNRGVLLLGTNDYICMTQRALGGLPIWFKLFVSNDKGFSAVTVSKDAKTVYAGTASGQVYRIDVPSLLDTVYKYNDETTNLESSGSLQLDQITSTLIGTFSNRYITDIACDATGNVICVTLGNYGNTDYIYKSTNAKSATPTFNSITSDLPKMPVYSVVCVKGSPTKYIIGTELGLYGSSDGGSSWNDINVNFSGNSSTYHPRVATYEVIEKTRLEENGSVAYSESIIYSGTHGRGVFRSKSLATQWPVKVNDVPENLTKLTLYPNPASSNLNIDFGKELAGQTHIAVYTLTGSLAYRTSFNDTKKSIQLPVNSLSPGAYVVYVNNNGNKFSNTFIKQ